MKFLILTDGDGSVGIPGDEAVLECDVSHLSGEDQKDYIEHIRQKMARTFTDIWGFPAYCLIEGETRD